MAVQTAGSFIEVLEKSQLLEPSQIKEACDSATNSDDPASIARYLLRKDWVTKWQAALLLKGRHRYKIGKYTIVDQIGAGTDLGQVYVAEHEQMGRRAVVKVLSQAHLKNEELVRRFLEEARKVAALDHRNLAHVFDIGEDGDRYFVVMEHVKGHDLAKLVQDNGPFPAGKAVTCATQALRGLAHAHEHGIVNGAIEPKNLLLDDNGDLKVLDTGEARLADALKQTLNKKFASPEQLSGGEPSAASDIYAVGRVLTYVIGGADKLSGDLRKIVARMTAEKPDDRFSDAAKAADLLEKWAGLQANGTSGSETATTTAKPPAAKPPAAKVPAAKAPTAKAPAAKSGGEKPLPAAPKPASKDTNGAGVANLEETTEFAVAGKKRKKKPVFRTEEPAPAAKAPAAKKPKAKAAPAKAKPAPKKKNGAKPAVAAAAAGLVADDPFAINETDAAQVSAGEDPLGDPLGDPLADPLAVDTDSLESAEPLETLPVPEEEPAAVQPAKSKGLPVALLAAIGGGVALLLLLLVSAVAAGVYMVSTASTEVAVNADTSVDPPEAAVDGNASQDGGEETPVETNVFGVPGGNPPPPVDGAEDPQPAADGDEPPVDDPKKPEPKTPEPDKQEPKKPEPKKPEPKKPVPKKPQPKKPDPKKPEPKKPAPKPVNPFAGLKGEIELKKIEDTSPLVLGKVTLNPRERPLVDLEGGESANPGSQKFKLEEVLGTSERRYEIFLLNSRVFDEETKIAEIFINDKQQAVLQWTTDAAADPVSSYLRNCSISFTSGRGGHVISLRKQAITEPIVLDMEAKSSPKVLVSIPSPPNKSAMYVEFELQGKDLPPAQFAGKGNKVGIAPEIEANGGLLYISFGNANLLLLRVTSKMSGDSVSITVTPSVGGPLNPSGKPQRIVVKDVTTMLERGRAAYTALSAQEKAANDFAKKNANNRQAAKQVAAAKQAATLAHGNLVNVEVQNKNLQQLLELVKKVNNKKLAFRVFLDADGAKNYMSKDQ